VHADVDARPGYGRRQEEERDAEPRERDREDGRAGEARRRMPGRERVRVRARDERVHVGPRARDQVFEDVRDELAETVGDERPEKQGWAAQHERRNERDREPERAVAPGVGERLEDRIEEAGAVRDLPALEVLVPAERGVGRRQTGTSALALLSSS